MSKHSIKAKFWIDEKDHVFLGSGRVELLRNIQAHGSISKAAKAMDISYRKAWKLAQSLNEQSGETIIQMSSGGKNGGGTTLSERGVRIVEAFDEFKGELDAFLSNKSEEYQSRWI